MFKKLVKSLYAVPALLLSVGVAFAQPVSVTQANVPTGKIAALGGLEMIVNFTYNTSFWLGGALILISVVGGLGLMGWKAWSGDDEAAKVAQTWFPKILLAGFAGILMVSAPTVFTFVQMTLGGDTPINTFDPNSTQFRQK